MTEEEKQEYYEDLDLNGACETCPKCGRWYDEIGFDFQWCKACGYDAEKGEFGESVEPTDADYLRHLPHRNYLSTVPAHYEKAEHPQND